MTRFYPIYPRRSDGRLEIVISKGRGSERNEPTEEQLDQRPDKNGVSDFYREVPLDETKHLDWRRKLGGMLAREMQDRRIGGFSTGHGSSFILIAFPENYRLYEHVKRTEKDGKLEVKNKTHAAGGNDRQDAYLYGHPTGRKKRYRSPADFFPHLLWLCTDESGDPDNCSCKLCQPDDLDGTAQPSKARTDKGDLPTVKADVLQAGEGHVHTAGREHVQGSAASDPGAGRALVPSIPAPRTQSGLGSLATTNPLPTSAPSESMSTPYYNFVQGSMHPP